MHRFSEICVKPSKSVVMCAAQISPSKGLRVI